jgi:hypothetical protein
VIRLDTKRATEVEELINQFYQSQREFAQTDPNLMVSIQQLEKEGIVVADPVNNHLLLSASPRYFMNIRNMIMKLDSPPPPETPQVPTTVIYGTKSPILFTPEGIK